MPTFVGEEEKKEAAPIQLVCETAFFSFIKREERRSSMFNIDSVCVWYIMKATLRLRRVSKHFRKEGGGVFQQEWYGENKV